MATLSAAERFGLTDRGALAPGRRADFCIVDDLNAFVVRETVHAGTGIHSFSDLPPVAAIPPVFRCATPTLDQIRFNGAGRARVIGLVPEQILTESLRYEIASQEIPDLKRDILKIVVCNRYRKKTPGVGLVHGFGFKQGAIASSVAHDAHNIVAVGTSDGEIQKAIAAVIHAQGAMVAVLKTGQTILPLDCAGLMSTLTYPDVVKRLSQLHETTKQLGGICDPFMYLSFLALTVIPSLRITDRGVFDVAGFRDVPLFEE
jgi:adenine deaminase